MSKLHSSSSSIIKCFTWQETGEYFLLHGKESTIVYGCYPGTHEFDDFVGDLIEVYVSVDSFRSGCFMGVRILEQIMELESLVEHSNGPFELISRFGFL